MKGSTTLLSLVLIGGAAAWLTAEGEAPRANPNAAPTPSALSIRGGTKIPLRYAGAVVWSGAGLRNGSLTVYCAPDGFVYGAFGRAIVALNGHSMSMARGGHIILANGERREVVSTDRRDLEAIAAIDPGADPLVYNRRADEGLQIGRKTCG
jgi:hypothetical protein